MAETTPAARRPPINEQLQAALNRQTVAIAERGLKGIDELKQRAVRRLEEKYGITEVDGLADELAHQVKRLLIRGLSK